MHKGMLLMVSILVAIMVAVPTLLVSLGGNKPPASAPEPREKGTSHPSGGPEVDVYLTREKRLVSLPMEQYIRGVVAAEMPADFHMEALKAQAFVARTYMADRMRREDYSDMKKLGGTAEEAQVTDTVQHQVYLTDKELKKNWGSRYSVYSDRIDAAVKETEGQVIQYRGEPIYAAFFSTSNGYTENSEDYFDEKVPYLRSVVSPWDKVSPKYKAKKTVSVSELASQLQKATGKQVAVPASSGGGLLKVVDRTEGKRISKVRIGDQLFTGRQVREALGLSSTDFTWEIDGKDITLITRGYGHGVGMSQWGAHLMAEKGKSAQEIIDYYYKGVEIADAGWKK
ncbi:stage II sporulation protein D [Salinithrix halophila]|uniref:Stage II sporulation protein D n=1 Tax=Salinithrix halophila TaxID=1485204 RepID=A0ABV8JKT7_9BACL